MLLNLIHEIHNLQMLCGQITADEDCYHIAGTAGTLSVPTMRVKRYADGVTPSWWSPMQERTIDLVRDDPITLQMEHFGAVARGEAAPLRTIRDGAVNVRVLEAIQQSARTGARAEVPA